MVEEQRSAAVHRDPVGLERNIPRQKIGPRGKTQRVAGLRAGMIIGSVYSLFSLVVVVFFGKPMTLLFVDASETVIIDQAYQFMVIQVAFFIPLTAVNVIRLLIQGMGYSKLAVFAGVFEMMFPVMSTFSLRGSWFHGALSW